MHNNDFTQHPHPHPRFRGPGFPGGGDFFGFGGGHPFGGWRGGAGGPGRARKGDIRSVILFLLADAPSNGYGLIKTIQEKSGGAWRPSPGSIYPTLQQLVDEGLIQPTAAGGARPEYELTDEGRAHVEQHREHLSTVFDAPTNNWGEQGDLIAAAAKLAGVVRQVAGAGTSEQRAAATTKLDELRRELYRMLGE